MARITTSKGEARLRPMLARDELILADLAEMEDSGEASAFYKIKGRMTRALDDALIDADWDDGFGELPKDEILVCFIKWDRATEEEALPNDSEPSSETPPEPGR